MIVSDTETMTTYIGVNTELLKLGDERQWSPEQIFSGMKVGEWLN